MTARPIIFGADSVRAILAGRKTQTRRVGRVQNFAATELMVEGGVATYRAFPGAGSARWGLCSCPFGVPGDRLWVREAFSHGPVFNADQDPSTRLRYRANPHDSPLPAGQKWRPPIFMTRSASRLTLEVVSVRVERLKEITVAAIAAEGVEEPALVPGVDFCIDGDLWPAGERKIRAAFAKGWDALNGKRAPWASNPWVWVVEFKVAS